MPKPEDSYDLKIGQTFTWEFTYVDPESDATEVSVVVRNPKLKKCRCMTLKKDNLNIWTMTITPNKKLFGELIDVAATLSDPLNTVV